MLRSLQRCCANSMTMLQMTKPNKFSPPNAALCSKPMEDLVASPENHTEFNYVPKFTELDQTRILDVLNKSTVTELERYDVTKKRVKNLLSYRRKNGSFQRLDQVLEVEGLGIRVFDKLCDSIINGKTKDCEPDMPRMGRLGNNLTTPMVNDKKRSEIQTATGIYVGVNFVSWAQLSRNGDLTKWDCHNYLDRPEKMDLTVMLDLALQIRHCIAESNVYVMESTTSIALNTTHMPSITMNLQRHQLIALIVSLLATKFNEPNDGKDASLSLLDNCYFLRARLPARLFRIMIGTEKVSARSVVQEILDNSIPKELTHLLPINVCEEVREQYERSDSLEMEAMSQALIVVATFMDLIVHRNTQSLKTVSK